MIFDYVQELDSLAPINNPVIVCQRDVHHL